MRIIPVLHDVEEEFLDFLRYGPRFSLADREPVHAADRRDFRRRAGEKQLVCDRQQLA
jgi:hypothetical protein